jgi:FKBP-type peptidyl-prolyl cis-trans isomerase
MKGITFAALAAGVMAVGLNAADVKTELTTGKQKAGYAIGANIGRGMKTQGLDIDIDALVRGFKDAQAGTPGFTDQELQEIMMNFQKEAQGKAMERGEKAKKEGEDFLAANKSKEGVKTTASGLQYKVLKDGKGPKPKATDTVSTHYRGTLIDGTEFDSSYKRGEPASFEVGQLIPGWTEALTNMTVGSKWQLYVPSNLAYGAGGQGPIPPNSTLIFEMELLGIKDDKAPAAPAAPAKK